MARLMLELANNGVSSAYFVAAIVLSVVVFVLILALCAMHKLYSKRGRDEDVDISVNDTGRGGGYSYGEEEEKGFGEGGLWQKSILMGDKCRPLEYSGVIFYDGCGNRVPEMPRSPNVAPVASPPRTT